MGGQHRQRPGRDHCRAVPSAADVPHASDPDAEVEAWAASGAMELTGHRDGPPLGPPAGLVPSLSALGVELRGLARSLGGELSVSPLDLLGERAALAGLHRRGRTSVGGATRLVPTADGWLAVSLARPDDVGLVPAWLEHDGAVSDPWALVEATARARSAAELVERAQLLGLPASRLGEATVEGRRPVVVADLGDAPPTPTLAGLVVAELGSLWATPLCGSLLQQAGATVVKVESTSRPDGARRGPPAFFHLLNAGKRSVALDLDDGDGRTALRELLRRADVVLEGSRPRALAQLGVDALALVAGGGPRVWASLTGHGREGAGAVRVAFGDDAAVAGGLVGTDATGGPVFCVDAIADPLAGVVAASAVLRALVAGGRSLLDVSLAAVAASFAGPSLAVPADIVPAAPTARAVRGRARDLGADTVRWTPSP